MIDSEILCNFHPVVIECLGSYQLERDSKYLKNYNIVTLAVEIHIFPIASAILGAHSERLLSLSLARHTVNYQDIAKWK